MTFIYRKEKVNKRDMMGWLDFRDSLREGDSVRMSLPLKPISPYSIN